MSHDVGKKKGLVLEAGYWDEPFEYWPRPSALKLAELAARLARTESIDPKQLVQEAWSLYRESCKQIQRDHQEVREVLWQREAEESQEDDGMEGRRLPRPPGFPVRFETMELLLLPKLVGRTADRARVLKEFFFAKILEGHQGWLKDESVGSYWDYRGKALKKLKERLKEEIIEEFGRYRKRLYNAESYYSFAEAFLEWYGRWTEVRGSEIKAANARKGWKKRHKAGKDKTGARPKTEVFRKALRKALEGSPPKPAQRGA